jgi:hypothetical protein
MAKTIAPENQKPGKESLADTFEYTRRRMLRGLFGMFIRDFKGHTWLDEADPAELPEAADAILLRQAARLAILAAGRLENALKTGGHVDSTVPADALVDILRRERDRAADFYLDVRRRQAKIAHLENLNCRADKKGAANERTIIVVSDGTPKPRRKIACKSTGLNQPGKAKRRVAPALAGAGRSVRENAPPFARFGGR